MSSRLPATCIWEIARQARIARWAWEALQSLHAEGDWPESCHPLELGERMHFQAQVIVGAAAQISKLLKPPPPRKASAAEKAFQTKRVAALAEIFDAPCIVTERFVRDALEHFDEKLDKLLCADPEVGLTDTTVAPTSPLELEDTIYVRYIDYGLMEYRVLDKRIMLGHLAEELEKIGAQARTWLAEHGHHWFEKGPWPPDIPPELQPLLRV